jgi:ribonuclease E
MTFTEAAIEVLRREGKPLHFKKIAEIAVRDSLLDHVGKVPEDTMADQLVAHCRLPRGDRLLIAVQQGTFALREWGLDEDPVGLENLLEIPPEGELAYRGRERHPVPSREIARATGREAARGRRHEEERRVKRFPPPADVAYELLAGAGKPLTVTEIATLGTERLLMPDVFVRDIESLAAALGEDNRRREASGRRALFQLDGENVTLVAQPEPGERPAPAALPAREKAAAPLDLRRSALAALRRRLRECDGPTVEHVAVQLLEKLGFKELKVAKRGREHVIYTGRRRMGLADLRHGIRVVRGDADATRRDVSDLRRDLAHYGAQIGLVIGAGEAARDARGEAVAAGQLPIVLVCGEAFAEALADAGVGCVPVIVPEVDEAFFKGAAEAAERDEAARRARREERDRDRGPDREAERNREPERGERSERGERGERGRDRREGRREEREERAVPAASGEEAAPPEVVALSADVFVAAEKRARVPSIEVEAESVEIVAEVAAEVPVTDEPDDGADDEAEGEDGDEADAVEEGAEVAGAGEPGGEGAAGAAGERRRRRRRRRRRGGRGRGREGAAAAGAPGTPAGSPAAVTGADPAGAPAPAPSPVPAAEAPSAPPPPAEPPGGGGSEG